MIDIEKLLRDGVSLEDIGDLVTNEMNAAQLKIEEEKAAAKRAEEDKKRREAIAAKEKEAKTKCRSKAVTAFLDYITLLDDSITREEADTALNAAVEGLLLTKEFERTGDWSSLINKILN